VKLMHWSNGSWHTVSVFRASKCGVAMALATRAVERARFPRRFAIEVRGVRYELVKENGAARWRSARGKRLVEAL